MTAEVGARARALLGRLEAAAGDWRITSTDHETLLELAEFLGLDVPTEVFRSPALASELIRRALERMSK